MEQYLSVSSISHEVEGTEPFSRCSIDKVEENLWLLFMYVYNRIVHFQRIAKSVYAKYGIGFIRPTYNNFSTNRSDYNYDKMRSRASFKFCNAFEK